MVICLSDMRSIPACAGEPLAPSCRTARGKVYPRVCGGTAPNRNWHPQETGLSPRVRGNRTARTPPRPPTRSIPACAGEPLPVSGLARCAGVYPRVCGGTRRRLAARPRRRGLSPRVRGNPATARCVFPTPGSIPACAGEPPQPTPPVDVYGVYPRVCGGTPSRCLVRSSIYGLSPRVRGNPVLDSVGPEDVGSIPACAGEPDGQ